jgi:signal transduction histidine kinase
MTGLAATQRYQGLLQLQGTCGGDGLGLAITKHIVEAHGGTLTATSSGPVRGATFTLTLPLADAAAPAGLDGMKLGDWVM